MEISQYRVSIGSVVGSYWVCIGYGKGSLKTKND